MNKLASGPSLVSGNTKFNLNQTRCLVWMSHAGRPLSDGREINSVTTGNTAGSRHLESFWPAQIVLIPWKHFLKKKYLSTRWLSAPRRGLWTTRWLTSATSPTPSGAKISSTPSTWESARWAQSSFWGSADCILVEQEPTPHDPEVMGSNLALSWDFLSFYLTSVKHLWLCSWCSTTNVKRRSIACEKTEREKVLWNFGKCRNEMKQIQTGAQPVPSDL